MDDGLRMVQARACGAWALPGDPTCAGIARRVFRRVASSLALDAGATDDGVMMVSELAANTLHARQHELVPPSPELWIYLRGVGQRAELVCKVFDAFPGWVSDNVPGNGVPRAPADAMSGRGLEVVHELSAGRWGHHLSRSRVTGSGVPGKAVWFAVPVRPAPAAGAAAGPVPGGVLGTPVTAGQAMSELEMDLGTRGLHGRMVRADDTDGDMAVLSIASGLTVWCRSAAAWLRAPGAALQRWSYYDLVEVAEQAVAVHESMAAVAEPFPLADASLLTAERRGQRPGRQPMSAAIEPYASSTISQKRSTSMAVATRAFGRDAEKSVTVIPDVSLPVVSTCTSDGV
jgi:hypothetical protein